MLRDADWERFSRDGYLYLGEVLTREEIAALTARADALAWGDVVNPAVQMQLDTGGEYEALPEAVGQFRQGTHFYRKIQGLENDELYARLIDRPVFREVCSRVYGAHAPVSLFRAMVMNKPAHQGTELPWHQDGGAVWQLDRDPLVTIWVALDEATAENGCMDAIAGSHRLGLLSTHGSTLSAEDVERHCQPDSMVSLAVPAGHAILMHNWLIHRSGVNPSPNPRRAFTMCCMDARTRSLLTGRHFPVVYGEQSDEPDHFVRQLQSEHAAQVARADEAERYALSLLDANRQMTQSHEDAACYARSLEAELKNCQSQRTSSEDGVRLTKAVAQMREEILELNQALKMAYDSPVRGDSEEIRRLHEQVWHLTAAVNALHDSRSWRITKPLRRLYSLVTGR